MEPLLDCIDPAGMPMNNSAKLLHRVHLVDDPLVPIISKINNYDALAPATAFTNANTSTTWQIQNVQIKCAIVSLDSGLHESYIKLLKRLPRNFR